MPCVCSSRRPNSHDFPPPEPAWISSRVDSRFSMSIMAAPAADVPTSTSCFTASSNIDGLPAAHLSGDGRLGRRLVVASGEPVASPAFGADLDRCHALAGEVHDRAVRLQRATLTGGGVWPR